MFAAFAVSAVSCAPEKEKLLDAAKVLGTWDVVSGKTVEKENGRIVDETTYQYKAGDKNYTFAETGLCTIETAGQDKPSKVEWMLSGWKLLIGDLIAVSSYDITEITGRKMVWVYTTANTEGGVLREKTTTVELSRR